MANDRLKREIAFEAARLIYVRQESEYYRAKMKAARRICRGWIPSADLPTNLDIRQQLEALTRAHDVDRVSDARRNEVDPLANGHAVAPAKLDRFQTYELLLRPLEGTKQSPKSHPEGDALYHSLQVFDLAREALPYDEEFQLAALLHDVGKAIDPRDHIKAALAALEDTITPRTAWLIEHHSEAGALRDGTLGARSRKRLEASPDFEELMMLCDCDRRGREKDMEVPTIEEALAHLRELAEMCGEG